VHTNANAVAKCEDGKHLLNFVLLAIARLDPDNGSATIESLQRAAHIVGREMRMQLV
jgi:hypothetical protein